MSWSRLPRSKWVGRVALLLVLFHVGIAKADIVIDQEQLVYNGGTSARTLPGYSVWQSFTAGITGQLVEIDMGFFNNMSGSGTLQIYSGQGMTGTLLQTLTVPVVGITQPAVTWDDWSVNVPVQTGSQYTFALTPNAANLPDPYGVAIGASDPNEVGGGPPIYSGGIMGITDPSGSYQNDNFATVFRTWVNDAADPPGVPEPSTFIMAGIAMIVGLGYAWHRRAITAAA